MCIIILRPAGRPLPTDDTMRNCWESNPDGGGLMWSHGGGLFTIKGLMSLEEMKAAAARIPVEAVAAYHFRIGTHGAKNAENTHPWIIDATSALMHNGVLSWLGDDRNVSDSKRLAAAVQGLRWWDETAIDLRALIESAIGYGNKVVFMQADGRFWIANSKAGMWEDGVWYSNGGFRKWAPAPYTGPDYSYNSHSPVTYQQSLIERGTKAASMLDQLMIMQLVRVKSKGEIRMRSKARRTISMTETEFFQHYDMYDYNTPDLKAKADTIAADICEELTTKARADDGFGS